MAQTIFDYRKTDGTPSRNVFDKSRRDVFGVNIGQLLPVFCEEVVPGDKVKVSASDLVRCMPLVTSPFARMKQHLDFYFVPYEQLWSNWLNFVNMKDDYYSSSQKGRLFVPSVTGAILNDIVNPSVNNTGDIFGISNSFNSMKLLDLLGYGSVYFNRVLSSDMSIPKFNNSSRFNLFRIAAYNKIWYDFYRQKYYDDGKHLLQSTDNAAYLFNFDYLDCSTQGNSVATPLYVRAMLQMRYRCWKKDLYTGLLPTTQQGSVSAVLSSGSTDFDVSRWRTRNGSNLPSDTNVQTSSSSNTLVAVGIDGIKHDHLVNSSFDILEFRRASAIQKWRENALRAGNRVEDSQRVRFGKDPYYHNDVHPAFLGSISSSLQLSDVNSTAEIGEGNNQRLGEYVGKGMMSFDGHVFTFDTHDNGDYGVIMGIYSILPDMEHNSRGTDYANCLLEVEDFYQPEYDRLGFQAVPNSVFNDLSLSGSGNVNVTRGFAPNYWYYKYALDKVHGEFQNDFWISGNMRAWSSPFSLASDMNYNYLNQYYANPSPFAAMFALEPLSYFGLDGVQEVNNFFVDLFFDVKSIRPMSILGLPQI